MLILNIALLEKWKFGKNFVYSINFFVSCLYLVLTCILNSPEIPIYYVHIFLCAKVYGFLRVYKLHSNYLDK